MNAVLQSLLGLKCFVNDIRKLSSSVGDNTLIKQLVLLSNCTSRSLLSRTRAIICRHGQGLSTLNEQV